LIAVIDYDVGNVKSVLFALKRIGQEAALTSDPARIEAASGVILPGVGAFSAAMEKLRASGLDAVVKELAAADRPILGICLGLQLFFTESEEHGVRRGLDILRGHVRRFAPGVKVPHMGWNEVKQKSDSPLFEGIEDGSFFYFAHSYYVQPEEEAVVVGTTDYGGDFTSAAGSGRIFGVQFHPEKSGRSGLAMLENFCRLCQRG